MNKFLFRKIQEPAHGVVFRDLVLSLLIIFLVFFLIFIQFLNPIGKSEDTVVPVGNMTIYISWPENLNIDVDLWVWNEKEPIPIGYSNREGHTLNLLRDDLGFFADDSGKNFEINASRGLPMGKWIINLHYFHSRVTPLDKSLNVPVYILVDETINRKKVIEKHKIYSGTVILKYVGVELTVVTFVLDAEGRPIKNTIETPEAYIPLREHRAK